MRILTWLFFATLSLVLLLQLRGIEADLRTTAAPWGIISYELAWTAPRAEAIRESWQQDGVLEPAKVALGVGMAFLVAYSLLLALTVRLLLRASPNGAALNQTPPNGAALSPENSAPSVLEAVGRMLPRAVLLIIPLGICANLLLWNMLDSGPTPWKTHLATGTAGAKFVLVMLTSAWSLLALAARVFTHRMRAGEPHG